MDALLAEGAAWGVVRASVPCWPGGAPASRHPRRREGERTGDPLAASGRSHYEVRAILARV
jgi:hypothetical protein